MPGTWKVLVLRNRKRKKGPMIVISIFGTEAQVKMCFIIPGLHAHIT